MSVTPVPEGFVSVATVIDEVSDVVLPVDGLAAVVCVVLTVVCVVVPVLPVTDVVTCPPPVTFMLHMRSFVPTTA